MRTTANTGGAGPHTNLGFAGRLRSDGNVPQCATPSRAELLDWVYKGNGLLQEQVPADRLPSLLPRVRPIHEVVNVDVFVPGCPPSADTIFTVISELLAGAFRT